MRVLSKYLTATFLLYLPSMGWAQENYSTSPGCVPPLVTNSVLLVETRNGTLTVGGVNREQTPAELRAMVLSSELSDDQRLRALYWLRPSPIGGQIVIQATTERLRGQIAMAAVEIATNSDDPRIKNFVWQALTGVLDDNLIEPLIHATATGVAAGGVAAVRALACFRGNPIVDEALRNIQDAAPEEGIRRVAHLALLTDAELHRELRATALDDSETIVNRRLAIAELSTRHSHALPLDREFSLGMVEFAKSLRLPQARWQIWYMLGQGGNEHFIQPAIEALNNDPDESVRNTIVGSLDEYVGYAGVRDAFEAIRMNDPSSLVRERAEAVLLEAEENDNETVVR